MTLYEHLQEVRKTALKNKDSFTFTKLGTVLGEAKQVSTKVENRDPTDEEVVVVVRKNLEGIAEMLKLETDDMKRAPLLIEQTLLQKFMPTQLSENEIRVLISNLGEKNLGKIMGFFKSKYNGKYDGKQVSAFAKQYIESN
jgi:uncharacterized protein YqeY